MGGSGGGGGGWRLLDKLSKMVNEHFANESRKKVKSFSEQKYFLTIFFGTWGAL